MRRATLTMLVALAGASAIATGTAMAAAPTATTRAASGVSSTAATLNGTVKPNKEATRYHFEYGTTTAYGSRTPDQGPVAGNGNKSVSATVTGLHPSTTYHFRVVAVNPAGTANGNDVTFTTAAAGSEPVTIAASPRTVTFGKATTIAGHVNGSGSGTDVRLESTPYPFTSPFSQVATGMTDASGNYSFSVTPALVTRYHVETQGPRRTSPDITVKVRPRVGLKLSDRTPRRGQRVRFAGTVTPAHNGKRVHIQRHTRKGWRTIASPLLRPAKPVNGVARSKYRKRIRVRHGGRYRTIFRPKDGDHVRGTSRRKRVRVH